MKCFFDLNESAPHFWNYGEMLKVAILSLRRHTDLQPVVVYDGGDNVLARWLAGYGVEVIRHRCRLYPELERLAAATGDPAYLNHGPGILLKADLADLCSARGWGTDRIVFCDCDVMFLGDPAPDWPELEGACFAAAPEDDPSAPERLNTGVMLIEVSAMLPRAEPFRRFLAGILPEAAKVSWDQHAYRLFFGRDDWRSLRPELNWKPYWGVNPSAKILHFHGPKPWMRANRAAGPLDPLHAPLAGPGFAEYCARWDAFVAEAVR
ncbi:MAG: hypothetical protein ACREFX_11900 [Opitutaceae bacterium]